MADTLTSQHEEIDRAELLDRLDAAARTQLDISGGEFARRYFHGELPDLSEVAGIVALLSLIDEDDPFIAGARG